MKKFFAVLLALVMCLSLCACEEDKVGEDIYAVVAEVCDQYIAQYDYSDTILYTVESIRYEINEIKKADQSWKDEYIVDITWYIDFSDTCMMERVWEENWISNVDGVLEDIEVDGFAFSHDDMNLKDSVWVVINGRTPQNGYEQGAKDGVSAGSTEDKYGHDRFDAIVIAEKTVKAQLKSPSTAKFCGNSSYTVSVSDNSWTVSGWVDAQNSFGAMLRSDFTVKFTFSSGEKYTIELCSIE